MVAININRATLIDTVSSLLETREPKGGRGGSSSSSSSSGSSSSRTGGVSSSNTRSRGNIVVIGGGGGGGGALPAWAIALIVFGTMLAIAIIIWLCVLNNKRTSKKRNEARAAEKTPFVHSSDDTAYAPAANDGYKNFSNTSYIPPTPPSPTYGNSGR